MVSKNAALTMSTMRQKPAFYIEFNMAEMKEMPPRKVSWLRSTSAEKAGMFLRCLGSPEELKA
jgi:hypothetical protein